MAGSKKKFKKIIGGKIDFFFFFVTEFGSVAAIDVEGLIALVDLPDERIEDEPVGTELLRRDAVDALVELVALPRVFVLAVLRWTFELLAVCE